ncbi:MAG: HD domain-containing protein [Clostridiales bacterium]|nr:HD domain-containing protein [Clostridiales bacterium]
MKSKKAEKSAPDAEVCEKLWEKYHTPEPVIRHSRIVAAVAQEMADCLIAAGCPVDRRLVYGSACMHDVARAQKGHDRVGAQWMRDEGYPEVAEIILRHHDRWLEESVMGDGTGDTYTEYDGMRSRRYDDRLPEETDIVYLADKYVQGDQIVSLEERFALSREKCKQRPDAGAVLAAQERRFREAQAIEKKILNYMGSDKMMLKSESGKEDEND